MQILQISDILIVSEHTCIIRLICQKERKRLIGFRKSKNCRPVSANVNWKSYNKTSKSTLEKKLEEAPIPAKT
jgi:hypothetical protein